MFDVGANIGDYTSLLLERFPEAQIHAFEPHPKNYSRLLAKIKNGNVKFYNMGIGEHKGNLTLYDRADHNGSAHASLYKEVISDIHKQKYTEIDVSVETLDEIASKEGIRYIDFLKIDTEGNELSVLKGAAHLIKTHSIGCIHFEFNEMNVISRVYFHDFCSALYDYDFYRLLPNGLLPLGRTPLSTELFAYQNILAIPKSNRIRD